MIECREIVNQVREDDKLSTSKNQSFNSKQSDEVECQDCKMLQKEFEKNPGGKPMSNKGLFLVAITGGAALALSTICIPFVTPALRKYCLPYVPATTQQVENVLRALSINSSKNSNIGQKLVDIGSGDGRIVLASAKEGYQAHGIELNIWLVLYSRWKALLNRNLRGTASFSKQDLWKSNLSGYEKVVIFGVEQMMPDLEKKLLIELKQDSEIVACRFPFPGLTPIHIIGEGIDSVWLYKIKKS